MGDSRERDLVLAPNEYAFILDETKGNVIPYVGPHKTSLANTDRPVVFEEETRRFNRSVLDDAICPFPFAEEGWYIVLENPAREDDDEEHPKPGPNNLTKLISGRKINIPGPATFPLWPGQTAKVIQGHQLRSNEYLVVKVYNEEAACENWTKAVIKPQKDTGEGSADPENVKPDDEIPNLTTGKLLVTKGTDVSFYIPPTGIEVLHDENHHYVRKAVTLERLEYCILLDEDGNKRFIQGPDVVFPKPTETFVEREGKRKLKAIELSENRGLYVKVIAPYTDKNNEQLSVGQELFVTGHEQMIYFPRPEHAIIKYGNQEIHYAVAIPAGEARYVLDRLTGEIRLKKGPCMFLPDPRKEVIVRRVLATNDVKLWFPGNIAALEYNNSLMEISTGANFSFIADREITKGQQDIKVKKSKNQQNFLGDDFTRQKHIAPRTITLNNKYEGAVSIDVWTGYAVLIVSKVGERKVIVGPQTYLLEYDEFLEAMELSTGTPKSDQNTIRTCYLRILSNKVSDTITAETKDLCQIRVHLSYRVNFEGDSNRWFNVENYVKFLTDHMRSIIRNVVKQKGVEEFYAHAINTIRDTILGVSEEKSKRKGRIFEENGMRIYDVEVLDVKIGDNKIEELLIAAQHTVVRQTIEISQEQKRLEIAQKKELIKQDIAQAQAETARKEHTLSLAGVQRHLELTLNKIASEAQAEEKRLEDQTNRQEKITQISEAELARHKMREQQTIELNENRLQQKLLQLKAEVEAVVNKAEAVSPDLIAAMQAFSDKNLARDMAKTMAPLAILGGKSIADVFSQLLQGTPLESVLKSGKSST